MKSHLISLEHWSHVPSSQLRDQGIPLFRHLSSRHLLKKLQISMQVLLILSLKEDFFHLDLHLPSCNNRRLYHLLKTIFYTLPQACETLQLGLRKMHLHFLQHLEPIKMIVSGKGTSLGSTWLKNQQPRRAFLEISILGSCLCSPIWPWWLHDWLSKKIVNMVAIPLLNFITHPRW